ncbi:phosphoprotein associated with glycosphingolipid-enriched microdomains 1 [Heptranchias perlo]|uniref:phosphoprotein associated with glycosphingolipid-enriched microdomains 1 n=1 Tax=Heptranchias perlo TaxID=212740 RepID=UPI00355969CF
MAPNSVDIVDPMAGIFDNGQHQVILWGLFAIACAFLLLTILIFLCNSCDRHLKTPEQNGDNENLMSVPSEKVTNSCSVISIGDELPANGHIGSLVNGDVLSDEGETVHSSDGALPPVVANQQDSSCKSLKCPQSRELPQIPGNGSVQNTESTEMTEGKISHEAYDAYEVLKDSSSQDIIIEDSLYETVKELKEESGSVANEIYGQSENADVIIMVQDQNAEFADGTAEYATVDKMKLNQQSISTEQILITEDDPPPLPTKELGENEHVEGEDAEAPSYKFQDEDPALTQAEIAAMYSTVNKPAQQWYQADTEQEGGYASIDEVTPGRRPSTTSHLYASVTDYEREPRVAGQTESVDAVGEDIDPGYESVGALKEATPKQETELNGNQSLCTQGENHYESIHELQQKQNINNPEV